jgi:hypothetical protein
MPNPVSFRRLWYTADFGEGGVVINGKPPIPWTDIKGAGVEFHVRPLLVLPHFSAILALFGLAPTCLHVCASGHDYPIPVAAVTVGSRWPTNPDLLPEICAPQLRAKLGEWLDRFPVVCPPGGIGLWWMSHGGWSPGYGPPPAPPPEPTTHERVETVEHELHDLQDQLRRIQHRKEHGHPPA